MTKSEDKSMCWIMAVVGIVMWVAMIVLGFILSLLMANIVGMITCKVFRVKNSDDGDHFGFGIPVSMVLIGLGFLVNHVHDVICAEGFKAMW